MELGIWKLVYLFCGRCKQSFFSQTMYNLGRSHLVWRCIVLRILTIFSNHSFDYSDWRSGRYNFQVFFQPNPVALKANPFSIWDEIRIWAVLLLDNFSCICSFASFQFRQISFLLRWSFRFFSCKSFLEIYIILISSNNRRSPSTSTISFISAYERCKFFPFFWLMDSIRCIQSTHEVHYSNIFLAIIWISSEYIAP